MVVIILFCVVVTIFVSKWLFHSYLSPLGMLGLTWGVSFLLLCIMTLSRFPLMESTWLVILGAWLAFLFGALLVGLNKNISGTKERSSLVLTEGYFKMLRILSILALLGGIRFAVIVVGRVGWGTLLTDSINFRHTITAGEFSMGTVTYFFNGCIFASAALGGIAAANNRRAFLSYLTYMPLLGAVLVDLFSFGRAHIITTMGIFITGYVASRASSKTGLWKINSKNIGMIIGLLIIVGIPFAYITRARGRDITFENIPRLIQDYSSNISQTWYLLDALVARQLPLTWGINTFFPAAKILYGLGLLDTNPQYIRLFQETIWVPIGGGSNTYTLLGGMYADFGGLGSFGLFFLLGLLTSYVFVRYRRRPKLWSIVALSFVYPFLFLSIQSNMFGSLESYVGLFLALGSAVLIGRDNHSRQLGYPGVKEEAFSDTQLQSERGTSNTSAFQESG